MNPHNTTPLSPELAKAFAFLIDHAITGVRCPVTCGPSADSRLKPQHIVALASRGFIRSEVSGHNWRQIVILTGPHAGKKTAPNPNKKALVYKVMDASGSHFHAEARRLSASALPSQEASL
jgi:hypothetical protein